MFDVVEQASHSIIGKVLRRPCACTRAHARTRTRAQCFIDTQKIVQQSVALNGIFPIRTESKAPHLFAAPMTKLS